MNGKKGQVDFFCFLKSTRLKNKYNRNGVWCGDKEWN